MGRRSDECKLNPPNPKGTPNAGIVRYQNEAMEKDNPHYTQCAMEVMALPKIKTTDPEQVQNRIMEYFSICDKWGLPPNTVGLRNALKLSHIEINNIRQGIYNHAVREYVCAAWDVIEEVMNAKLMDDKVNPAGKIFLMKNHFGYSDTQNYVVTPKNPLGELPSADELKQAVKSLPPVEDEDNVSMTVKDIK